MGIGKVFSTIANGVRGAGRFFKRFVNPAKKIIGKVVPKAIELVDKYRKISPQIIDKAKEYAPKVFKTIDSITDVIPNGRVKDKINELNNKARQTTEKVISTGENINNKVNNVIDQTAEARNKMYDKINQYNRSHPGQMHLIGSSRPAGI